MKTNIIRVDSEFKKFIIRERKNLAKLLNVKETDIPFSVVTKIILNKLKGKSTKIKINSKRGRVWIE